MFLDEHTLSNTWHAYLFLRRVKVKRLVELPCLFFVPVVFHLSVESIAYRKRQRYQKKEVIQGAQYSERHECPAFVVLTFHVASRHM